jgi:hypothetical protein
MNFLSPSRKIPVGTINYVATASFHICSNSLLTYPINWHCIM